MEKVQYLIALLIVRRRSATNPLELKCINEMLDELYDLKYDMLRQQAQVVYLWIMLQVYSMRNLVDCLPITKSQQNGIY